MLKRHTSVEVLFVLNAFWWE